MLLLEKDITRKRWEDELSEPEKFEARDNKEYKVEAIIDSVMYGQ